MRPAFWCKLKKKTFIAKFCNKFVTFLHFFSFLGPKMLKMKISTSIWGEQHPNTGQNIQQLLKRGMANHLPPKSSSSNMCLGKPKEFFCPVKTTCLDKNGHLRMAHGWGCLAQSWHSAALITSLLCLRMFLYWSVDPYINMYNCILYNRVQCIDKVYY